MRKLRSAGCASRAMILSTSSREGSPDELVISLLGYPESPESQPGLMPGAVKIASPENPILAIRAAANPARASAASRPFVRNAASTTVPAGILFSLDNLTASAWLNAIKPTRIVGKNFSFDGVVKPFDRPESSNGIELARSIAVPVVSADDEVILSRIGNDISKVVIALRRDVDVIPGQ